jgi:type II secretory pathway pseudopilin PulG
MIVRTGPIDRDTGAGFTLVELLLAVALLLMLLGAVVYNFSGLQRGAQLDEGAQQIEALIRFASAYAANSGKQVQIAFEEDVGEGLVVPLGNLRVLWEPDPVARPGVFEPLIAAAEYVRSIGDLISIEDVRLMENNRFETANEADRLAEDPAGNSLLVSFPPIAFFPDGSSDSAEITLASRSEEDGRRIAVRLQGITGAIHRKVITNEPNTAEPECEPQPARGRQHEFGA